MSVCMRLVDERLRADDNDMVHVHHVWWQDHVLETHKADGRPRREVRAVLPLSVCCWVAVDARKR